MNMEALLEKIEKKFPNHNDFNKILNENINNKKYNEKKKNNEIINPLSGSKIKENGKEYNKLIKIRDNYNDVKKINNIINNDCSYNNENDNELSDDNLLPDYLKTDATKINMSEFNQICEENNTEEKEDIKNFINKIVNDKRMQLKFIISHGTKGGIRGKQFEKIVSQKLKTLNLPEEEYSVEYQKECEECDEKPDHIITNKITNKKIILMEQISLTDGGAQANRRSKYLNSEINNEKCKLLCLIWNKEKFNITQINSKKYKEFKKGFESDTLCYINGLEKIIKKFFEIEI